MFWLIGWVIFGLVVGIIARGVVPGEQPMGLFRTMLLGVSGSFIGGLVGYFIVGGSLIQSSGWIGSIIGAIALLALQARRNRLEHDSKVVDGR